jgi:hypothetical protein
MARRLLGILLLMAFFTGCVISPRRGTTNTGTGAGGKLYVATAGSLLRFGSALTANGNVAPEATISGSQTQLSAPQHILLDVTNNRLLVANQGSASVLIFQSASTASGNIAPNAVLTSPSNMVSPVDIAIDAGANLLYVADGQNILVFSGQGSLSGNVNTPPVRTVNFTFTIGAILLDAANNRLFIADPADNAVQILPNASSANGPGTSLVNPLVGAVTLLQHPNGLAFDGTGRLIVSNLSTPSITIYPASAIPGGGNVPPVASLTGSNTKLAGPGQLAFNTAAGSSGELYVADALAPGLFTYLNAGAFTLNDNLTPTRTISGTGTNLNANAVNGMALDTSR